MDGQMNAKTVVITGATGGIGLETARALVTAGADVAIGGRNAVRGHQTLDELKQNLGAGQKLTLYVADLASQADIHRLAAEIHRDHDHIDVLINNAGAFNVQRSVTVDGYETTIAVNHQAYFLLTALLLDLIRKASAGRIVNVSSCGHAYGSKTIDFDDLDGAHRYRGTWAYFQSKLANVLFTNELARRLGPSPVTVNALHPGDIGSGFGSNNGSLLKLLMRLARPFLMTPQRGAETSIYLATSPEVAGKTAGYYVKKRLTPSSLPSLDQGLARRLWEITERRTGNPYAAIGL